VHGGEAETGIYAAPIDVHGARTALAMIASLFGSGQMEMLPQAIEQSGARIDPQIVLLAVHTKRDWNDVRFRPFGSLVLIGNANLLALTVGYGLELRQAIIQKTESYFRLWRESGPATFGEHDSRGAM
jgi:hypothetical protein